MIITITLYKSRKKQTEISLRSQPVLSFYYDVLYADANVVSDPHF